MTKRVIILALLAFVCSTYAYANREKTYTLASPNGRIIATIIAGNELAWSLHMNGQNIFDRNKISLSVDGVDLGKKLSVRSAKQTNHRGKQECPVPAKSKIIEDNYTQLQISFRNDLAVSFRLYDNGMAYRFEVGKQGEIIVDNEVLELNFAKDYPILFPEEVSLLSHYEREYARGKLSSFDSGKFCSLPTVVEADNNVKIGITEADLFDYPGLFLEATGEKTLKSKFPKVILEAEEKGDRDIVVKKEADYIAKTRGKRNFPWRTFLLSEEDKQLVENQLVFLLSRDCEIDDTSWIKPGLVSWDWWNENNIYNVDFRSGINTRTYKYYIDFAAKYEIPYIIIDAGWSKTTTNLLESSPDINIPELVAYGKERNVDLILWSLWGPLDKDMDAILDQFQRWGVKGLKVDFMAQAGQSMVNFYERIAKECAERHLLVDFHGSYKPAGLRKAYPNVVNYEGVKGLENSKSSKEITPEHDLTLPFTRMLAGPMDFTPGAMQNVHPEYFSLRWTNAMSMGTRCHQLAMFIVYDSPLQMICDSPSNYYKEEESIRFISQMKTVWDETKIIDAKITDYIVTARKSGSDWYIGAMTDSTPRTLNIDLSFLDDGEYELEIMQDGINADKIAIDYKRIVKKANKNTKLEIKMAQGGGYAAICRKL
ncbi:MAG: glycoside hydrolase family 97 protein [Bacteroidales bacterium]